MGGRQSKRSVDITTTPKKEGTEDQQQPLDGRLGHIEEGEGESKPAANGAPTVSATDIQVRKSDHFEDCGLMTSGQWPETWLIWQSGHLVGWVFVTEFVW